MNSQHAFILAMIVSVCIQACLIIVTGSFLTPLIPRGINWFAVAMILLNVGAAVYALTNQDVNKLIYGLAAAVLNMCVYFDFTKIMKG